MMPSRKETAASMESQRSQFGWANARFGDVVHQVKDKVDAKTSGLKWYVAGEHMDTDDLRIRRRGEITDDYLGPAFHMRFKSGHVMYGSRRTYLRKVAVADFEGYIHFFNAIDGEPVARERLGKGAITSDPLVMANRLYVQSDSGRLGAYVIVDDRPQRAQPDVADE